MKCPNCNIENIEYAEVCDCGYCFKPGLNNSNTHYIASPQKKVFYAFLSLLILALAMFIIYNGYGIQAKLFGIALLVFPVLLLGFAFKKQRNLKTDLKPYSLWQWTAPNIFGALSLLLPVMIGFMWQLMQGDGFLDTAFQHENFKIGGLNWEKMYLGEWYRILTGPFLHANFSHLFNNSLALFCFGMVTIQHLGLLKIWTVFLSSILLGAIFFLLFGGQGYCIGASGGVYGILAVYTCSIYFRSNLKQKVGRFFAKLFLYELIYIGLDFYSSSLNPEISLASHAGGFIAGVGFAFFYKNRSSEHFSFSATA